MAKNDAFALAVIGSCFCVLILLAIFVYSGTILPTSVGMTRGEAVLMWLAWTGIPALPVITVASAVVQLFRHRRQ